jgi:hypothetical protein
MINVDDQFLSFRATDHPALARLARLAKPASIVPSGVNRDYLHQLPRDHRLVELRATLDEEPPIRELLKREYAARFNHLRRGAAAAARHFGQAASPRRPPDDVAHQFGEGHLCLNKHAPQLNELKDAINQLFGSACHMQGHFYYPPGGYRTWHSNRYDRHGWRMYLIDVTQSHQSFFRLKVPSSGEILTHWDEPGMANFFLIDPGRIMWHCIASETDRWSRGFAVPDDWMARLTAH